MNFKTLTFLKLSFLFAGVCLIAACVKNDNLIKGDAKIKFYNNVLSSKSQIFYVDGGGLSTGNGTPYVDNSGIAYSGNSSYLVAPAIDPINVYLKDFGASTPHLIDNVTLDVGGNYSAFYTKKTLTDSSLLIIKEDLTPDTTQSKLIFLNLGYTLKSKVIIRDSLNSFNKILGYGEKSDYVYIKFAGKNKLYFNLVDSVGVVDTLKANNFYKGKVYTILLDGSNIGKLKERSIVNN